MKATPEEMAKAFDSAYSRHLVDGLFLSSGIIKNPEATMTLMLDTAAILREKYDYRGYLHLKIMPGTSSNCIGEAMKLADRVSLNIESPTESTLADLSPDKELKKGFFYTLSLIKRERRRRLFAGQKVPSLTTQFVIGASRETDREIIKTTHFLYKNFGLTRVFYSAFRPVPGTPLEKQPAASLAREHRLYQADFLMRYYRFDPWEIPLNEKGFLSELIDPKTVWAQNHPEIFPINLNRANYWQLLKVPGIGPVSAKKIIKMRQKAKIRSFSQFLNRCFQINKLSPYICF